MRYAPCRTLIEGGEVMSDFDKIIDIYPDPYLTDKGKAYAEGFRHGESKALLFAVVSMLIASICISVYKLFM
jgi:hypothetical protein